jgi:hypothetical protein
MIPDFVYVDDCEETSCGCQADMDVDMFDTIIDNIDEEIHDEILD